MNRKTKIALLSALSAVTLLVCSGCSEEKTNYTGRIKVFNAGEHRIAVNTGESASSDNILLPQVDGYKITDVTINASNYLVIVYENTETVECAETGKGYTELGIPADGVVTRRLKDNQ